MATEFVHGTAAVGVLRMATNSRAGDVREHTAAELAAAESVEPAVSKRKARSPKAKAPKD